MIPLWHDCQFIETGKFSFLRNFIYDNQVAINGCDNGSDQLEFTASEVRYFSKPGFCCRVICCCRSFMSWHVARLTSRLINMARKSHISYAWVSDNGRKKPECVVEAMLSLHQRGIQAFELVLAGARRKRVEKFLKKEKFAPLSGKFHFVFNPNQAELRALYEKAYALLCLPNGRLGSAGK